MSTRILLLNWRLAFGQGLWVKSKPPKAGPDAKEKFQAYLRVAVVSPSEIVHFLGAKDDKQKTYVTAVAKNLNLNERQAAQVVQVVQVLAGALRGDNQE